MSNARSPRSACSTTVGMSMTVPFVCARMATSRLPMTLHRSRTIGNHQVANVQRQGGDPMSDQRQSEVHEETIGAPPADVWGFMVDPAALSAWFGADAWLDPEVGGGVLFRFADGSLRRGTVLEVDRTRRLSWRWREQRGVGFGLALGEPLRVTIELDAVPDGTRVRITESPLVQARGAA